MIYKILSNKLNNKLEKANSDNFEFIFEDFMNLNNFPSIIQCWIT